MAIVTKQEALEPGIAASVQLLPPLLISIKEARRLLSVGESRVYGLMRSGDLKQVKVGKRTLISYQSAVALAERGTAV